MCQKCDQTSLSAFFACLFAIEHYQALLGAVCLISSHRLWCPHPAVPAVLSWPIGRFFWCLHQETSEISARHRVPEVHLETSKWRFPKIGVALNHPFFWIFPYKPSILRYPQFRRPPFMNSINSLFNLP